MNLPEQQATAVSVAGACRAATAMPHSRFRLAVENRMEICACLERCLERSGFARWLA